MIPPPKPNMHITLHQYSVLSMSQTQSLSEWLIREKRGVTHAENSIPYLRTQITYMILEDGRYCHRNVLVFWGVTLCHWVRGSWHFRERVQLTLQGQKSLCSFETLGTKHPATWWHMRKTRVLTWLLSTNFNFDGASVQASTRILTWMQTSNWLFPRVLVLDNKTAHNNIILTLPPAHVINEPTSTKLPQLDRQSISTVMSLITTFAQRWTAYTKVVP